ncbi:NadS family protein [Pseudoxanthomonas dokdonensis]|uniref:Cro/Cl family transcriptional regulator n=1 Tax=Pseudoxanthomonas dokdonensis TaxID=344882 RepID=A0A0R0CZQ2_9GAMM|nr:NadS family protein [Pseudoxanthomonas dokdonensis]KRG71607.1 Cro/Cl family transcriptional regulator [Pseudoxanthomonas dokdonensis]
MDKNLFAELMGSVSEANEILKGERSPSREVYINAVEVRAIRKLTGLSQQKFANIIHVEVSTLRNWEQGRRDPTGPARALLRVIKNNPKEALRALAEAS